MAWKYWSDEGVYDLLVRMDGGYIPNEEEKKELAGRLGLNLMFKNIHELPRSIGILKSLESLDLSETQIAALPESIGNNIALKFLDLNRTRIDSLPESIGNLKSLKGLYIRGTRIAELPESIGDLRSLENLDLCDTQIVALPERIGELPNLRKVNLTGLKLDRIPESLGLKGLPFVDEERFSRTDTGVNLRGVTLLLQDVSIFLESPSLIPSLYEGDTVTMRECKVIFLGDGGAGKSYTIKRIKNGGKKATEEEPYSTSVTHGVEISDWPVGGRGGFTVHLWDFGGQDVMHSMHRCFLTDKTCYVVTVDTRRNDGNERAAYWLRNVKEFAPNCPVLLYVNCVETDREGSDIDEAGLREAYPMVKDAVYCSARDAEDAEFRESVMDKIKSIIRESGFGRERIPRRYFNARREIGRLNKKNPILTREEYHEVCANNEIEDENASDLLTFFNNIGVCFSYHRGRDKKELAEYKLLQPIWLTNAVYALIQEGRAHAQNGALNAESVSVILCNNAPKSVDGKPYSRTAPEMKYEEYQCSYILDVAESHELCYRRGDGTVFFPALLTPNTPKEVSEYVKSKRDSAEYRFDYGYLPDNVVHRLMIRFMKNDLVISSPWRRGFTVGAMGIYKAAIFMEKDSALRIVAESAAGSPLSVFFSLLRREVKEVNLALNLTAREEISVGSDSFTLVSLINANNARAPYVYGQNTGNQFEPYKLLNAFFSDRMINSMEVDADGEPFIQPYVYVKRKKENTLLRKALYHAYGEKCMYCGEPIAYKEMQVDHILATNHVDPGDDETKKYIEELEKNRFDISNPDYVENYLPVCGPCNRLKLNKVFGVSTLRFYHEAAMWHTPKVLELWEKYKREMKEE